MTQDSDDGLVTPEIVSRLDLGDAGPYAIAFGADGEMWVTLVNTGELLRRSPDGAQHRFAIGERPGQLVVTAEATWCAVSGEDKIAMVTDGRLTFIDAPGGPYGLAAAGTDVWTTLMQDNKLALLGPGGLRSNVTMPVDGSYPAMVAVHEDGSVWAALNQAGALVRKAPTGDMELIGLADGAAPVGIATAGEDVWATDIARGCVVRIDRRLRVYEYPLGPESRPHAVIADTMGCWFTEWGVNRLGRIKTDTQLTEFDLSDVGDEPHGLALDRDGIIWVAFESGAVVGIAGSIDSA